MKQANMKLPKILSMMTMVFVAMLLNSSVVNAKNPSHGYSEFEVPRLSMKLSNDGTGIIKDVSCGGCNYKFVKITRNTNVYVNNVKVNLFRARERAGKPVFIQFVRSSGEVMAIRWME